MAQTKAKDDEARSDAGIASSKDNDKLEHSQGGRTTRDDPTDLGVPMLPGDASERQGPEDALGEGPKRGDYSERVGPSDYHPTTVEPIPADEREEGGPNVRVVNQRPRASDQGEVAGKKGGVETAEA